MNNLRILIYSNPLIVDKISKKFIFWRDSGFIFSKNLVKSFPEDCRIYWLIPDKIRGGDLDWFFSSHKNIELISYPYSTSIHQNRYEYYGNVLRENFPYSKDIDVIICNQPEVAANLRVWGDNQRRDLPLIYSFFHWIDCEESREFCPTLGGYFWREYDGSLSSDAIYLHKPYGTMLFKKELNFRSVKSDGITFRDFTPPPTLFGKTPIELPNKKIILFNHRLNNTTRWKEVLDMCSFIYQNRQDFVLWMTDENGNLKDLDKSKFPFLIMKQVPDESYGYLISKSHFSVCNHRGYSTWNMAVLDAIMNGCFTLVPNAEVYSEMFGDRGKEISMYHNFNDLKSLVMKLLDVPIDVLHDKLKMEQDIVLDLISPLSKIYQDIQEDLEKRLSFPKKYENVLGYILGNGEASKAEWVNKFWSFHVNSNFQKIRWNLLSSGLVEDDVSKSDTIYRTAK